MARSLGQREPNPLRWASLADSRLEELIVLCNNDVVGKAAYEAAVKLDPAQISFFGITRGS